jgi:hypothetical protein
MCDLPAGASIIAAEGAIDVGFRDSSLSWLGDAMPVVHVAVDAGCRYRTEQRGLASVTAIAGKSASIVVSMPGRAPRASSGSARPAARGGLLAWFRFRLFGDA